MRLVSECAAGAAGAFHGLPDGLAGGDPRVAGGLAGVRVAGAFSLITEWRYSPVALLGIFSQIRRVTFS